MNLDRRLLRFLWREPFVFGTAVLFGVVAGVAAIFQAKVLSGVIASVHIFQAGLPALAGSMGALLGWMVVRAASAFASERSAAALTRRVKSRLRSLLAEKVYRLGPLYTSGLATGDLTSVYMQGVDTLDAYFSQYLPQILFAGLLPLMVLGFVFPIDWISGIVLALTGPVIPFFMFLIGSSAERLTHRQFGAMRRMSAYFLDTLQGLRALKELGRSKEQVGRIRQVSEEYRSTTLVVLRVTFLSAFVLELLGTISTAMIAVQVGLRLIYGQMDFEPAFFLLLIAPEFYQPLRTLGLRFHASMNGISAAQRIFALLNEPEGAMVAEPSGISSAPAMSSALPEIAFERVSFQYPQRDVEALSELDFRVPAGKVTALVGESGAGKTTALWLLLRFVAPQSGRIQVDGADLAHIPVATWRERLAWVPQKPYLLNDTIFANLRIGKKDANEQDLAVACELANLSGWLHSLPDGLNTRVGEGGARISGGQAQRLALARAFLRDAPLLLMDEPTAHLDPPEESLLVQAVQRICQRRTVLMVAHRISTVRAADQIVVFSHGRAVEAGNHATLSRQGGVYAGLIAAFGASR